MTTTDYKKKVIQIIADKAGLETSEVEETFYFEDDLNMGKMDLVDILEELEETFQIELVEEKDNIETVQDIMDLVSEQVE